MLLEPLYNLGLVSQLDLVREMVKQRVREDDSTIEGIVLGVPAVLTHGDWALRYDECSCNVRSGSPIAVSGRRGVTQEGVDVEVRNHQVALNLDPQTPLAAVASENYTAVRATLSEEVGRWNNILGRSGGTPCPKRTGITPCGNCSCPSICPASGGGAAGGGPPGG